MEPRDRAASPVTDGSLITAWRVRLAAWSMALVALAFIQAPGRIVSDTKLDLAVAPGRFLERALHLWDGTGAFGQVQNQAYGYLFPMGPFFWLGSLAHVPPWAVQRLWWALVLVVAFLGMIKLLGVLGVGSPWARIVASLAFALSPRMLTVIGPTSIEVWPTALAPWVLVPLVIAVHRGDPRRGAALSALAVALVGGVNAVATFAVVPLAVWWIWSAPHGPRRRALMVWWPPLVVIGTAWWLLPLFLLGRYSPPFLDYIESISNTSFPATTVDALRGTTNWIPYVDPGSSAGRMLISEPLLIANGTVLVALGLYGLARSDLPWRGFVIPSVFVGLAIVTLGHVGSTSGLGADSIRSALDSGLAPLRNAHKYDVLVRLPLVIGMCHGITALTSRRTVASIGVVTLAVAALVGAVSPAWSARLAPAGTFTEIPDYWQQASTWLENNAEGRTLLTPASPFGRYLWGRPNDEPLQPLLSTPWAVRNVIPLAPGANIDMLDAVSRQLATGRGSTELATTFRTIGVGTIVLRHDLDRSSLTSDSPETVRATMVTTPGVRLVASFGPMVGGGASLQGDDGRLTFVDGGRQSERPALEVFSVDGVSDRRTIQSRDDVSTVVGDTDSLIRLRALGALAPGSSTILGPDVRGVPDGSLTLTDGNRRQEAAFAQVRRNRSASLSEAEPYRVDRAVHRYDEERLKEWTTTPSLIGASSLTASSSRADVGASPALNPAEGPWAAFDGDPATSWRPSQVQGRNAWIDLDLGRAVDVGTVTITLDLPRGAIRELQVNTESGPREVTAQGGRPVDVAIGTVSHVRLEATRTPAFDVAVSEVTMEGVEVSRPLKLPTLPNGWQSPTRVLIQAQGGGNDGCVVLDKTRRCSDAFVEKTEDGRRLDRLVSLPSDVSYEASMRVTADAGRSLDAVLQRDQIATAQVSSQQSTSALGGALAVVDGSARTGWIAAGDDPDPTLTVRWLDENEVESITLKTPPDMAASQPRAVRLVFADGQQTVEPVVNGQIRFDPIVTNSVEIHLLSGEPRSTVDFSGSLSGLALGVAEVEIPGVRGFGSLVSDKPVLISCAEGPSTVVDGRLIRGLVRATVADLASGNPVPVTWCDTPDADLSAGLHRVQARSGLAVRPADLLLQRTDLSTPVRAGAVVLGTRHNANEGWRARTPAGETLTPVVLDGWRQAWMAPDLEAARAASVDFEPDSLYRTSLVVGLIFLLALGLFTAVPERKGWEAAVERPQPGISRARWQSFVAMVAALVVAGIPAGIAVMAGLLISRVARRWWVALPSAAAAIAATGALLFYVSAPWGSPDTWAGDQVLPQLIVWLALGAVLAGAVGRGLRRRKGRSTSR